MSVERARSRKSLVRKDCVWVLLDQCMITTVVQAFKAALADPSVAVGRRLDYRTGNITGSQLMYLF